MVIARFQLSPDRVVAVPEAAAEWFLPVETRPQSPYFLFVGTIEPRKNLPLLVEAWREVRKLHPVELVVAGRRRSDAPAIAEEPGLRLLGEVPDEQLPELYSGAIAFVYPSLYEGFGLPVVEAMQCGACVIASPPCARRPATRPCTPGTRANWRRRCSMRGSAPPGGPNGRPADAPAPLSAGHTERARSPPRGTPP